MINAKLLKDDKEYRERIEAKKVDPKLIDDFLEVELKRGELIVIVDDLRAQKNLISKEIGKANPDERKEKIEVGKSWGHQELGEARQQVAR